MKTFKSLSWLFNACMIGTLLLAGAPLEALAGKPQPNPFRGTWCGVLDDTLAVSLTISNSGRVTGTFASFFGFGTLSGKVSDSGTMQVIMKSDQSGRSGHSRISATAILSFDADGSLSGIWLFEDYEPIPFIFVNCG